MAVSKSVLFVVLALSLLLSGADARGTVWTPSELQAKCCNNHPDFGICDSKEDDRRCEAMCLSLAINAGCKTIKGGGCQAIQAAPGAVCSCYCFN